MGIEQTVRVLLIDDDKAFAEHFRLYAAISEWQEKYLDISELDKLTDTLRDYKPNLILLDNSKDLHQWLDALDQQGYINKTYVTLGRDTSQVDKFSPTKESLHQQGYSITDVIHKPFRLAGIPSLIIKSDSPPIRHKLLTNEQVGMLAKQLKPAISIHLLDPKNTGNITINKKNSKEEIEKTIIWRNENYNEMPISDSDQLSFKLMVHGLTLSKEAFVRREEWNADKQKWTFSRLYLLNHNHYWFVREYRDKKDTPQFFHQNRDSLEQFLNDVAEALKQWGITRLRFYKTRQFYDDTKKTNKSDYVLIPYFSKGKGFKTKESDWRKDTFTTQNSSDTKQAFRSPAHDWYHKADKPGDEKSACDKHIAWPPPPQKITRIEIPIFITKPKKRKEPVGLLAFDRRYDHIRKDRLVTDYSWWKVVFNEAGEIDPGKIEDHELNSMEVFFKAVTTEIQKYRKKDKANQLKLWHEAFTETIRHLLDNMKDNDTVTSSKITQLFLNRLINWWEFVDDEPTDEDIPKNPPSNKHKHIINWYFLKEEPGESVLGIGGYGPMAEHYSITHSRMVRPFRDAVNNSKKHGNYLIQDFSTWLGKQKKQKGSPYIQEQIRHTPDYEKHLHSIKAWAGFPIKAGRNSYLMVVHADTQNYFTTRRTKLLRTVALRLTPFLLWGDSVNLQTLLLKMLNHELNTPLSVAKQTLIKMPETEKKSRAIDNFEFLEAVIKNMSYLYKEPNSNTTMTTRLTEIWDVKRIANTLATKKRAIFTNYENDYNQIELAVSKDVLRQVMFNLLSNAFKFADGNTKIDSCITIDVSRETNQLVCRISNPTIKEMTGEQLKWIFALGYKVIGTGPASGYGLGLAIVDILCKKTNMKCDAETPIFIQEGIWQQTFTLKIPIAGY